MQLICRFVIIVVAAVLTWITCTAEEYDDFLEKALVETKPNIIVDDGGDLVAMLHTKHRELLDGLLGGSEETTTGVLRLHALAAKGKLDFPMIAANDAYCKYLFDNRYGTGQSTWDGIMRTTNLIVAGKNVVIAGYGWCGKGGAMRAKGLGANVIITEVDPIKAIEAVFDEEAYGEEKWYDMQGRRINKPTKAGLYIKNGQKLVIKNK